MTYTDKKTKNFSKERKTNKEWHKHSRTEKYNYGNLKSQQTDSITNLTELRKKRKMKIGLKKIPRMKHGK